MKKFFEIFGINLQKTFTILKCHLKKKMEMKKVYYRNSAKKRNTKLSQTYDKFPYL